MPGRCAGGRKLERTIMPMKRIRLELVRLG